MLKDESFATIVSLAVDAGSGSDPVHFPIADTCRLLKDIPVNAHGAAKPGRTTI